MKPRIQILVAAALFSTAGAAIKMTALSGWQVAAFRSGIAALVMAVLLPEARKRWNARTLLVGAAYAATLTLFVLSNKLTTSANATFLQSAAPLYLLILGPWLLKEPLKKTDLLWMCLFAAGLVLVLQERAVASATATDPVTGNILATVSGVAYALMLCGLRWLGRGGHGSGLNAAVAGNCMVFLVCLPKALSEGEINASTQDWQVVAWLGIVQIALAYYLLARGVEHVPALETSLLMLLEPAVNPIWSMLIHGEKPGLYALAGGAIILGSTFAVLLSGREPAASRPPRILDSTPT